MKKPFLVIKNLTKSFGSKHITRGVNLEVNQGEFLVIIGRSGEGKSVLLKQIVGLIEPSGGSVYIDGINVMHAHKTGKQDTIFQRCGYVFQFAALLDSLTVFENVGITLLEQGKSPKEVLPLVEEKIAAVGLAQDVIHKYPSELSGGMKKRVGLARTLMRSPQLLIYDEPTTGLDPISVHMIHELMRKTHDETNATTVVISHDPEIFKFADRVAMLYEGKIIYVGNAQTIWEETNPYVHQFIRGMTIGPITMASEKVKST